MDDFNDVWIFFLQTSWLVKDVEFRPCSKQDRSPVMHKLRWDEGLKWRNLKFTNHERILGYTPVVVWKTDFEENEAWLKLSPLNDGCFLARFTNKQLKA